MAWGEIKVEDKRREFICKYEEKIQNFADLCRQYEISRPTGYKWVERFKEKGLEGLHDKSRAPLYQACETDSILVQRIIELRIQHPTWGPKKVLAYLKTHYPIIEWPSTTTIGNIFDRNGLTVCRKYRRRVSARTALLAHCQQPNDVWCADFKGWFLTGDQQKCEPFTLTDGASRFLLRCVKLNSNDVDHVWGVLDAAFREFGLPLFFRSDNGPPFASCGAGRLSRLSVKLIKAGVIPEWIDPGKPQQNGRHERMHQTLKRETATPPQPTLEEQKMKFQEFIHYFNFVRPHEALEQKTPGSVYCGSERVWNRRLKSPEYPKEFVVRKVRSGGQISWKCDNPFIGYALSNEPVGLKEVEDGKFQVHYGPIILGILDNNNEFNIPKDDRRRGITKVREGVKGLS